MLCRNAINTSKNGLGNGNITRWLASAAAAAARRETVIATAVCMQWRRSVNIDRCWLGTASLRAAPASSAPRARISLATLPVSLSRRLAALFRCILGRIACKTWKRGQSSPLSLSATSLFRYFFSVLPARRYASAGTSSGPVSASVRHKSVF